MQVNHVVELVRRVAGGERWEGALQRVLPTRKRPTLRASAAGNGTEEGNGRQEGITEEADGREEGVARRVVENSCDQGYR